MTETLPRITKPQLTQEMDTALQKFLRFLDQIPMAQVVGPTDAAGWTVRDHVTHLAVWAEGIAALLHRENRWAAMGLNITGYTEIDEDIDRYNEQIAQAHRNLGPEEARDRLVRAHAGLTNAVEALSEDELNSPYDRFVAPFTGQEGAPVYAYILGNTAHHYDEHTPWIEAIIRNGTD